jgi:hypothetical protein
MNPEITLTPDRRLVHALVTVWLSTLTAIALWQFARSWLVYMGAMALSAVETAMVGLGATAAIMLAVGLIRTLWPLRRGRRPSILYGFGWLAHLRGDTWRQTRNGIWLLSFLPTIVAAVLIGNAHQGPPGPVPGEHAFTPEEVGAFLTFFIWFWPTNPGGDAY